MNKSLDFVFYIITKPTKKNKVNVALVFVHREHQH